MADETKDRVTIKWDRAKLGRLKEAYQKCGGKNFTFEGHEFVPGYAKYLIEYLEGVLK